LALVNRFPRRRRRRDDDHSPAYRPASRLRRYRLPIAIVSVVVLAVAGYIWGPTLFRTCGPGLHSEGSPYICAGLNLESSALRNDDPLADLEKLIAEHNSQVTGNFKTIVMLENLTADSESDSTPVQFIRHEIEGAIAATWPDGKPNGFKLLLANFGGNAEYWRDAVNEIVAAGEDQHIMAVTGVGVSLDNTRAAVAELSRNGIATVGATVTADNMNRDLDSNRIKNFFRVAPTNSDETSAAANYIAAHRYRRVMLVADTNESESYASTLAEAFQMQQKAPAQYTKKYSTEGLPSDVSRDQTLRKLFAGIHNDICSAQPDAIYFAGRGVDLRSFVTALSDDGACQGLSSVTVISGDDTATLVGSPLPQSGDIGVHVLYTGLAYPEQWKLLAQDPAYATYLRNYQDFANSFLGTYGFSQGDLGDGSAMIQHDAVATAITAAQEDPSSEAKSLPNFLTNIDCNSPVPGATGFIAFAPDTGNQVDKAMPILQILADGSMSAVGLVWSQGLPLDTSASCR
jgi:ABC-type branched-subunit amino acid transport system substrate-binding protein